MHINKKVQHTNPKTNFSDDVTFIPCISIFASQYKEHLFPAHWDSMCDASESSSCLEIAGINLFLRYLSGEAKSGR